MTQSTTPTAPPSKSGSSTVIKILLILLTLFILFVLAALGSCIYLGYRAKKKVDEIQQAYKSGELDRVADALGVKGATGTSSSAAPTSAPLSFPAWTPSSSESDRPKIRLAPGFTAVSAVAQFGGDYQSVLSIQEVTPESVKLSIRADNVPNPLQGLQKLGGNKAPPATGTVYATRIVMAEDMRSAHELQEWFSPNHPDAFPGTTAISASRDVMTELKEKGETSFTFGLGGLKGLMGSVVNPIGDVMRQVGGPENAKDVGSMGKATCTLKRVDVVAFPILVNNERVSLPALHAQCTTEDGLADFYFLDDPDNALNLAFKLGDKGDAVQTISITYPKKIAEQIPSQPGKAAPVVPSGGPADIERQLEQNGKAEVYGIYFDFGSDRMKPESEPVLREIAAALDHNPSWNLRVEGHTDNVGAEAYNMELSQRRAAAVKGALVTRYHIDENRLAPDGFGATRPKESNDTIAGRARNRRVELVRK